MNRFDAPNDTLDSLYAAATDFGQWAIFLEQFAELFDASAATFDKVDYIDKESSFSAVYGLNPNDLDAFAENLDQDPRIEVGLKFPEKPFIGEQMVPESVWRDSGMYRNIFVPNRIEYHIAAGIPVSGTTYVGVGVYRPPGAQPYTQTDCYRFGAFIPHFKRVINLQAQFLKIEKERWAALSVLNDMPIGILVTDSQTRVQFINRTAREISDANNGLTVRHNELWANKHADSMVFRDFVRDCVDKRRYGVISIPRSGSMRPLHVRVSSIAGNEAPFYVHQLNHPLAAIYVTDPDRPHETPAELLQRLFGLTPAEARLTALLVSGKSVKAATEDLDVTENTTRAQLKSVFNKTGASRQAELIKMVMSSPVWIGTEMDSA